MKIRFAASLLAVSIAVVGSRAGARTPVIAQIPSVVIGDEASLTAPNLFVYPDALSLDLKVSDDSTFDADIRWSYIGTGRYRINNVLPLNPPTDHPVVPGPKRIDTQDHDPDSVDADPDTVTFRDVVLSPPFLGNTDPGAPGIVHSEALTLFASDGTTAGMRSLLVYTDNDGQDRLSGENLFPPIPLPPPRRSWLDQSGESRFAGPD